MFVYKHEKSISKCINMCVDYFECVQLAYPEKLFHRSLNFVSSSATGFDQFR